MKLTKYYKNSRIISELLTVVIYSNSELNDLQQATENTAQQMINTSHTGTLINL